MCALLLGLAGTLALTAPAAAQAPPDSTLAPSDSLETGAPPDSLFEFPGGDSLDLPLPFPMETAPGDSVAGYSPTRNMVRVPGGDASRLAALRLAVNDDAAPPPEGLYSPGFLMDRTEVTNREFARFLSAADSNARHFDRRMSLVEVEPGRFQAAAERADFPVAYVDWFGAFAYAAWAGKSLPTEEEWMLAGLGGRPAPDSGYVYPWGDDAVDTLKANVLRRGGFPDSRTVASYARGASPEGIYDLSGNVAEWTLTEEAQPLPGGTEQRLIVVKGGSFLDPPENVTLTARALRHPRERLGSVGFRCIIRLQPEP